jgi:hypothetical protein
MKKDDTLLYYSKDDPGYLPIEEGSPVYYWFMENTGEESWTDTVHRMTHEEGIPCTLLFKKKDGFSLCGILFSNPKQKLDFLLKV